MQLSNKSFNLRNTFRAIMGDNYPLSSTERLSGLSNFFPSIFNEEFFWDIRSIDLNGCKYPLKQINIQHLNGKNDDSDVIVSVIECDFKECFPEMGERKIWTDVKEGFLEGSVNVTIYLSDTFLRDFAYQDNGVNHYPLCERKRLIAVELLKVFYEIESPIQAKRQCSNSLNGIIDRADEVDDLVCSNSSIDRTANDHRLTEGSYRDMPIEFGKFMKDWTEERFVHPKVIRRRAVNFLDRGLRVPRGEQSYLDQPNAIGKIILTALSETFVEVDYPLPVFTRFDFCNHRRASSQLFWILIDRFCSNDQILFYDTDFLEWATFHLLAEYGPLPSR